uniref:Ig-like domain-containing protein n=1 Tax=Mola mola TaxID=94237 RepID=A0A3Q3WCT2_MOLML
MLVSNVCLTDVNCTDSPVFTPARLVVEHGDPVSATCTVCRSECSSTLSGLEKSVGVYIENGTTFSWTVDSMTEWGTSATCYYNDKKDSYHQCCGILPVTVYKIPDNVSISLVGHTGPMLEGHQYTLECAVRNVAPVKNLVVTFYRGRTPLSQVRSHNKNEDKPVDQAFTLNITGSKKEDGVDYYCEAKLEFEMAQPRPMVQSPIFTATVHYKPQFAESSHPDPIGVTEEEPMRLNCSAVGNPSPSYAWTHPSQELSQYTSSVLTIQSATLSDDGQFTCTVNNSMGIVTKKFNVKVHGKSNIIKYIIIGVVLAIVVAIVVCGFIYTKYYRHNRMGKYDLMRILRRPREHSTMPSVV